MLLNMHENNVYTYITYSYCNSHTFFMYINVSPKLILNKNIVIVLKDEIIYLSNLFPEHCSQSLFLKMLNEKRHISE